MDSELFTITAITLLFFVMCFVNLFQQNKITKLESRLREVKWELCSIINGAIQANTQEGEQDGTEIQTQENG